MTVDDLASYRQRESSEERRSRRLAAFAAPVRPLVSPLLHDSEAMADLADSFPALLFALATGYGTAERRALARVSVEQGISLRGVAERLALPWWLRRLPAQAFLKPLDSVPASAEFAERIGALLPSQPGHAAAWLAAVLHGHRACHADYALWVAAWANRQPRIVGRPESAGLLVFLAAWAWHATAPGTAGHALLRRPWSAHLGGRRALDEVMLWRRRMALELQVGAAPIPDWLADGEAQGYSFHGLRSAAEFVAEAQEMDNCLDQFSDRLEGRRSHVFSIRKGERCVADVEIGVADIDSGMPAVLQLRGRRNRRAPPKVWQATYAWLGGQSLRPLAFAPADLGTERARRAARALWRPYLDAIEPAAAREFALHAAQELGVDPVALVRRSSVRRPLGPAAARWVNPGHREKCTSQTRATAARRIK